MVFKLLAILFSVITLGMGLRAFGVNSRTNDADRNTNQSWQNDVVQKQIQVLKARVLDFYHRLDIEDAADRAREQAEVEMRIERKKRWKKNRLVREEYVKNRKAKVKQDRTAWELELKRRAQLYEEERERYIERRNKIRSEAARIWHIPEDVEFDLDQDSQ